MKGGEIYEDESESGSGWITWFCDLEGHEFFVEIDEDYIRDNFNLHGLRGKVQNYTEAMKMILSSESPDSDDLNDQGFLEVYQSAMDLYGLIHARFILSPRGLAMMREKYLLGTFGYCPRVMCERQNVLPVGMSEELSTSRVKVRALRSSLRCTARSARRCTSRGRSTWTSTGRTSASASRTF